MDTNRRSLSSALIRFVCAIAEVLVVLCQALGTLAEGCRLSLIRYARWTEQQDGVVEYVGDCDRERREVNVRPVSKLVSHETLPEVVNALPPALPESHRERADVVRASPSVPVQDRTEESRRAVLIPTANGQQRFYAVASGRRPGLFSSWISAGRQVNSFSNSLHQRFGNRVDAVNYVGHYFRAMGIRDDVIEYDENEQVLFRYTLD